MFIDCTTIARSVAEINCTNNVYTRGHPSIKKCIIACNVMHQHVHSGAQRNTSIDRGTETDLYICFQFKRPDTSHSGVSTH